MTSRFEGTPNALLEAMACGLPAVVSDASPGPCELIGDRREPRWADRAGRGRGRHGRRHHPLGARRDLATAFWARSARTRTRTRRRSRDRRLASPLALRVRRCGLPSSSPASAPEARSAWLLSSPMTGAQTGHEVTLVTFDTPGDRAVLCLGSGRRVCASSRRLRSSRGLRASSAPISPALSRLRSVLRELRPDVVVAFMTEANVVALWACLGLGVPVVISERNQPDRPGLGKVHKLARRLSYPKAHAIVVQTDAIASWVRGSLPHSGPRHSQSGCTSTAAKRAASQSEVQ